MSDNVYRFRRLEWGDPEEKLKQLREDWDRGAPARPTAAPILAPAFAAVALLMFLGLRLI